MNMHNMKFLLVGINSKYIHMTPAVYSLQTYVYEAGILDASGSQLAVAEYTINQSKDEILGDLYERRPDVVGFACYIWNWQMIQELIVELKKLLPETDLFLGGPEVSYEAAQIMEQFGKSNHPAEEQMVYPVVTGIILGEGEKTFKELVEAYVSLPEDVSIRSQLQQIRGLLLESGYTGIREALSFDELPFLYEMQRRSGERLKQFEHKILYYESSRGCPFRCSYCLSSVDKTLRLRSLDRVLPELQFFLDCKVPQVKFIDRTFNCNREHAMTIWNYLLDHDNGVTNFHFEIAAELLGEEELCLFQRMRPGLIQLEIGVQTTNPDTLCAINRRCALTHLEDVVARICSNHNIHVHLDLIAGLPQEDYESFIRSFNDVYRMKPEQLQLGFLKVLKGTQMFENAGAYGLVYQSTPPYEVLYTKWISYAEIRKLKRVEEMVEMYYNSNQFTHTLAVLTPLFETPFALYEKLSAYYETNGYFIHVPARAKRYEVLFQFICEFVPEYTERFRELLTFDFYLRENAKSRPSFCRDQSADYEAMRGFYEKEEKEPLYLKAYADYHARQVMKMTHMEVFYDAIWQSVDVCADTASASEAVSEQPIDRRKPVYVLFDYQRRDPLTGEVMTQLVSV